MLKRFVFFLFVLLLAVTQTGGAVQTGSPPGITWLLNPPTIELTGSDESQRWQNYMADKEGLFRIQNRKQLLFLEKVKLFVRLPQTSVVQVDPRLKKDAEYCYALPRVVDFLKDRAVEYKLAFPRASFQVSSAVRDVAKQKKLRRGGNKNAADTDGPKASSHLTGATVDITKRKMTKAQIEWWREKLLDFECMRVVEATEEFRQACFHFMVFGTYVKMYPDELQTQSKVKVNKKVLKKKHHK